MNGGSGSRSGFRVGCHLSIAGGFAAALREAEDLGNTALQFFSHNPSAWRMKPIDRAEAGEFRRSRSASPVEILIVHAMYLLNLASPNRTIWDRSIAALREELLRAGEIGADAVVTHLGAHRGSGSAAGIDRIVDALDRVLPELSVGAAGRVELLLENTAGAGTTVGATFDELGAILKRTGTAERVGICLDTAHAFAAGYDLRSRAGLDAALSSLDRRIGLERLRLIHLNDSLASLSSRRDRHAHIGEGKIGRAGIRRLLSDRRIRDRPYILETPKEIDGRCGADRINLARVRSLRTEGVDR